MSKKKGLLRKVGKFVGKLPRETFRVIDQGLGLGNKAIEKTRLDKVLAGGGRSSSKL